jgi:hypothetical protein
VRGPRELEEGRGEGDREMKGGPSHTEEEEGGRDMESTFGVGSERCPFSFFGIEYPRVPECGRFSRSTKQNNFSRGISFSVC